MRYFILLLGLLLTACAEPLSAPTPADPTLQWDRYNRDAQATLDTESITREAIARFIRATDVAGTQAAVDFLSTQSAQATAAEYTHQADATSTAIANSQATATALVQATQTAVAHALATETAHANSTSTAVAEVRATQNRIVEATTTQAALDAEIERIENARLANAFGWVLLFGVILACVGLIGWGGVSFVRHWRAHNSVVTTGPFGNPILIFDGPQGSQVIVDPSRLFGPATVIQSNGKITAPVLTNELMQARTTLLSQLLAFAHAQHLPSTTSSWSIGPVSHQHTQAPRMISRTPDRDPASRVSRASHLPDSASWQVLDNWRGGALPLGLSPAGLLLADPETSPHYLMAGTSGSGKTRFGLRPLITVALADGWQVIILDRSGLDFLAFRSHSNAVFQILDDPARSVTMLSGLYSEIQRRFVILREAQVSTLAHLPVASRPPRLLCVVDEFSNLADSLAARDRDELWRWARMIAAEGRKAGVHLALALQDPTHKSLDLRIRRNCTPIAFRVKDGEASRVILGSGGAETLAPRQFMTVMGDLIRAVAFAPDDDEINAFLAARPVRAIQPPTWLDAPTQSLVAGVGERPDDVNAQILALHGQHLGVTEIQRRVFGTGPGGRDYYRVKQVVSGGLLPENKPESRAA